MKYFAPHLAIIMLLLGNQAKSQDSSSIIHANASVGPSCLISAPQDLDFGTYNATDTNFLAPNDKTASFVLRCNKGSLSGGQVQISLGPGLNQQGSGCIDRHMKSGEGYTLAYQIHTSASRATSWGCMDKGESGYSSPTIDDGNEHTIVMYGRIPAAQGNSHSGQYSDQIDIYLSF